MPTTTDPTDPRLTHGIDDKPVPQAEAYLVLSEEDIAKGYQRPFRTSYRHTVCGVVTTMAASIAQTYAACPIFYRATYCSHCCMHKPVEEFTWEPDGSIVGS